MKNFKNEAKYGIIDSSVDRIRVVSAAMFGVIVNEVSYIFDGVVPSTYFKLREDGSYILREDGGRIIRENG